MSRTHTKSPSASAESLVRLGLLKDAREKPLSFQ
jgi:hypothetical protein